jgi:hypothetical protein
MIWYLAGVEQELVSIAMFFRKSKLFLSISKVGTSSLIWVADIGIVLVAPGFGFWCQRYVMSPLLRGDVAPVASDAWEVLGPLDWCLEELFAPGLALSVCSWRMFWILFCNFYMFCRCDLTPGLGIPRLSATINAVPPLSCFSGSPSPEPVICAGTNWLIFTPLSSVGFSR